MSELLTHPRPAEQNETAVLGFEFTNADESWLKQFGVTLSPEDLNQHTALQESIAMGAVDLRSQPELHSQVIESRRYMQRFLCLGDDDRGYLCSTGSDQEFTANNYLASFRLLHSYDSSIELKKVIESLPAFLSLSPDGVKAKVENLQSLVGEDIDLKKVIESLPAFLGYSPDGVKAKAENLQSLVGEDIDLKKVIEGHSAFLGYSPMKIDLLFALLDKKSQKQWFIDELIANPKSASKFATSLDNVAINLMNGATEASIFVRVKPEERKKYFSALAIDWLDESLPSTDPEDIELDHELPEARKELIEQLGWAGMMLLFYSHHQVEGEEKQSSRRIKLVRLGDDDFEDPNANAEFFSNNTHNQHNTLRP